MKLHRHDLSAALLCCCLTLTACSTGDSARAGESKPNAGAEHHNDEEDFAGDPMGVASRWADGLPETLPTDRRDAYLKVLTPLPGARVVRLVRVGAGRYRAVVASEVESGRKAVILSIQRGSEAEWRVDSIDIGASTAYWPNL